MSPARTKAEDKPSAPADTDQGGTGADELADLADRLKKHGIDVDKWKDGDWKNWGKDKWLREAKDFVNPVIEDLWKPERMKEAKDPVRTIDTKAASDDAGVSDPEPRRSRPSPRRSRTTENAAPVGKIFFDTPEGPAVCSGTVVKDPNNPGKSNLVWTAGHCVHHGGKDGGWYRNIAFVPAYNTAGKSRAEQQNAKPEEIYPYGEFWVDWASTSPEWIDRHHGGDHRRLVRVRLRRPARGAGNRRQVPRGDRGCGAARRLLGPVRQGRGRRWALGATRRPRPSTASSCTSASTSRAACRSPRPRRRCSASAAP